MFKLGLPAVRFEHSDELAELSKLGMVGRPVLDMHVQNKFEKPIVICNTLENRALTRCQGSVLMNNTVVRGTCMLPFLS